MAGKQHAQALMRAIGPQLDLLEVTEFEDGKVWTLVVDETTVLFADYDDAHNRLVLSADVAQAPEAGRLQLYELLLQYNNQWSETGGLRMALDPGGGVVQLFELPVTDLDLVGLQTVVTRFVDVLGAWREIVSRADAAGAEPAAHPMLGGMIRG